MRLLQPLHEARVGFFELFEAHALAQVSVEGNGEVGQQAGQVGAVGVVVGGQAGVQQHGQVAAVVHELAPEAAAFVKPVVGRVGAEGQQQAEQDAQKREKLLVDGQVEAVEFHHQRRHHGGVEAHPEHALQQQANNAGGTQVAQGLPPIGRFVHNHSMAGQLSRPAAS